MTSRERVLPAFQHREQNGIAIDFFVYNLSGIAASAYAKLRQHLGLPPKPLRVYDRVQQFWIVDPKALDLFGVDASELGRTFALDDGCWADWVLLSDLTEAALDAANSVQTSCQEMEPTGLKSEFGRTMVDCRLMLEQGFSLSRRTHWRPWTFSSDSTNDLDNDVYHV